MPRKMLLQGAVEKSSSLFSRLSRWQLIATTAQAKGKISELELQIIQIDQELSSEVAKEMRDVDAKIGEFVERKVTAEDQLRRIDIRAPQSGTVLQLSVHTVGGVIGAGETMMLIVPQQDQLVVEARVAPVDIDQITKNAPVQVRIMAGNQRTTPAVDGVVTHISADLTRETAGAGQPVQAYFLTRVSLNEKSLKDLGDLKLVPGMPGEPGPQGASEVALTPDGYRGGLVGDVPVVDRRVVPKVPANLVDDGLADLGVGK